MFRCIFINSQHTCLQNILRRDDPGKPICCLQLQTVTYGLKGSTYLATRCLVELANRYKDEYPLAAKVIISNTYVDDILSGADNLEEINLLKVQLVKLLQIANFKLHNWCSNYPSILEDIPQQDKYFDEINLNSDKIVKTLGLKYNVILDHFYFHAPLCEKKEVCLAI